MHRYVNSEVTETEKLNDSMVNKPENMDCFIFHAFPSHFHSWKMLGTTVAQAW